MPAAKLEGRRFGRLLILSRSQIPNKGVSRSARWLGVCDCGAQTQVSGTSLQRGHTRSCGCLHKSVMAEHMRQRNSKHNGHGTPTYKSWKAMQQRCNDPNHRSFVIYGGRGITVCDRWRSFENFLADMGERPEGKTLDRWPNNDGNYEPSNCRWATPKEQQANRRITKRMLELKA